MENQELMDQLLANARQALAELEKCTQEEIDGYCKAVCLAFKAHAEELAIEAVEETGMGNVPDKITKNTGSPDGVWYAIKNKKSVGIIGHDADLCTCHRRIEIGEALHFVDFLFGQSRMADAEL